MTQDQEPIAAGAAGEPAVSGYPSLSSVPQKPELSYPVAQRRAIVEGLVADRENARYTSQSTRYRTGLSLLPPPPRPPEPDLQADQVVGAMPGRNVEGQGLEDDLENDAYGLGSEADEGTLDDFIRNLERDTAPAPITPGNDQTSNDLVPLVGPAADVTLARPLLIMPAQQPAEDRPKICESPLGWIVSPLGICPDQPATPPVQPPAEQEAPPPAAQSVEPEPETDLPPPAAQPPVSQPPVSQPPELARPELLEPVPQSEEAVMPDELPAGPAPTAAPKVLPEPEPEPPVAALTPPEPVLKPLEPLEQRPERYRYSRVPFKERHVGDRYGRERYGRERRRGREAVAVDAPPRSKGDPLEQDITIVHNGRAFHFDGLPAPEFKPPPDPVAPPTAEILPARRPLDLDSNGASVEGLSPVTPPQPELKPALPEVAGLAPEEAPVEVEPPKEPVFPPSTSPLPPPTPELQADIAPDSGLALDDGERRVIAFPAGSAELSPDSTPLLRDLLNEARASNTKIYVIGEADRAQLALARAREVGLALVRLGATSDLIEFDIADNGANNQVTLLLK